ncbi:MAG: histidinol-phosphate aminotransferase family protein [Chitinophaga sp.]|uniref:aminotransferase class I/II-fold pyridoxal phosphate-dependent enzyme n=1 Tax=Chitinophaga sp. TaxID=1869181 RepID=UPI0025C215C0|nr:aminotransferase class I/II-fold pyridoxal phosphate-dependent enzyme [Chitinophaga sp.]MBV8251494.1 histidinol-phosphate aminotransferase family protein [Chitinophaga sp.]
MMKANTGNDTFSADTRIVADFSTDSWYGGLRPELKSYLITTIDRVVDYPDKAESELQALLEKQAKLTAALLTNGVTQAIYLIAQAFAGATTTIVGPAIPEYTTACTLYGHQIRHLPREKVTDILQVETDLFFISNPGNPDGQVVEDAWLEHLISANRKRIFVVDETYIRFTRNASSLVPHLHRLPNVFILQSPARIGCFPGLRLGYVLAQKALLEKIRLLQTPRSVNQLALAAGLFTEKNPALFKFPLDNLLGDAYQLRENIKKMAEFKVYPSYTHFFLFETLTGTSAELNAWLIEKYGIVVKDVSEMEGLTIGSCRITCRNELDNKLLLTALKKWSVI